jgi:hypothetical protein
MKNATITIERGLSQFPVTVTVDAPSVGWYEHPTDGAGDVRFDLSEDEQDQAREALMAANTPEPREPEEALPTNREADDAANAYAGYRNSLRP